MDTTIHELVHKHYDLKKELKIQFVGEEGIDAGGVKQEFFQLIVREIFDLKYGMFTFNKETRLFWFNKHSLESEQEYHLIGMIIGLAIYNGVKFFPREQSINRSISMCMSDSSYLCEISIKSTLTLNHSLAQTHHCPL